MYRRLYFLFPSQQLALRAVKDLEKMGIVDEDIHAFAEDSEQISALPKATERQKKGVDVLVEKIFWNGDLILFFIALAGLLVALLQGSWLLGVVSVVVMLGTFLIGYFFTSRVPKVHLNDFDSALHHGEILLTVDVPKNQIMDVEKLMQQRHPEAANGGVGWSLHSFGI